MNFPIDNPILQALYWLVNTAGVGGLIVGLLATSTVTAVALMLRRIAATDQPAEGEQFAYPTTALHHYEPPKRGFGNLRRQ